MLDQYFTPEYAAQKAALSVVRRFDPYRVRGYIEPSVGGGVFVRGLLAAGVSRRNILTIDVDPAMEPDYVADFLELSKEDGIDDGIVIGNPPFGRSGTTAHRFVDKALELCDICCFVMPLSSAAKPHSFVASFDAKFEDTMAKCCWAEYYQHCFEPLDLSTPNRPLLGIEFVTKDDRYDIVIQRCGGGMGRKTECNGTGQGKYYIKIKSSDYIAVLEALNNLEAFLKYLPALYLTTHQPSLNRQSFLELFTLAYFEEKMPCSN